MANLQELMLLVLEPRAGQIPRFAACVTPKRGDVHRFVVRAHDANRARLAVQKAAARHFKTGFTFTVRPE